MKLSGTHRAVRDESVGPAPHSAHQRKMGGAEGSRRCKGRKAKAADGVLDRQPLSGGASPTEAEP